MSARNRELFALIPATLLLTAGFAAVFIQRENLLNDLSLTYGAIFLALCLAAHLVLRLTLPDADPYLFPLVAVLACFGLVMLYRLDEELAREQAQWFVVGLVFFTATIVALRRDHRVLERYRYVIALGGILLLLLPRLGNPVNGAYLSFDMGPISFQPAELAKIAIVIFLASYLRDTRQVLVIGARRFAGITFPPLKHLGPLLAVWGTAMLLLFVIQDLGSSLMFFGGFLALVYVATNRISFVIIGVSLFALGARVLYALRPTIESRVDAWLHPFDPTLYNQDPGGSFQIAQSIFSQADGGLFGQGFGQAIIDVPSGRILPAAHTDFIYAVLGEELGLVGTLLVLALFLTIAYAGFRVALRTKDPFVRYMSAGITIWLTVQMMINVGMVLALLPVIGIPMPLVSYGGSALLPSLVALGLLLSFARSEPGAQAALRARRRRRTPAGVTAGGGLPRRAR